jgi:hypothetical protein
MHTAAAAARTAVAVITPKATAATTVTTILGAISGLLGTAEAFCAEKGIAPEDIIKARLAEDMLPFAY